MIKTTRGATYSVGPSNIDDCISLRFISDNDSINTFTLSYDEAERMIRMINACIGQETDYL